MIFPLLAASLGVALLSYSLWLRRILALLSRSGQAEDLADITVLDWPGIIGTLMPRRLRRHWNLLVVWGCTMLLGGTPHGLVLYAISTGEDRYLAYVVTLVWLSASLGLPALILTRDRLSAARYSTTS